MKLQRIPVPRGGEEVKCVLQESVASELYTRPDWRDRYEVGWREGHGMPE